MNPYRVVEDFEAALCEYTGAKYAVTTNSCSMALFLALASQPARSVVFPSRTYCSAPMAALNAGYTVSFFDREWVGEYLIVGSLVYDSARRFRQAMFRGGVYQCVSFQTSKILGIEQGGAILHDNDIADEWLRRARFDGRLNASEKLPKMRGWHCYMNPSTAALGLQRLSCLPDNPPDNGGSYLFEDLSKLKIWN